MSNYAARCDASWSGSRACASARCLDPNTVFQPPYAYSAHLTPASQVEADVKAGAGPK